MDKVISLAWNVGFTIVAAGMTIVCGTSAIETVKDLLHPKS